MLKFHEKLKTAIHSRRTSFCLGIDPDHRAIMDMASSGGAGAIERALFEYSGELLRRARAYTEVVKFQSAFFECFGAPGFAGLCSSVKYAKDLGYFVILDAKRSDIATTMRAYGKMAFEALDADVLTITPYLGFDTVSALAPWLEKDRGIYVVLASSNPSGSDIQEFASASSEQLFESVMRGFILRARQLGFDKSIGFVVGATKVEQISQETWSNLLEYPLLLPGIGAQGAEKIGRLESMGGCRSHLFPISRAVVAEWEGNTSDYWSGVESRAKDWSCLFYHD